MPLLTGLTRILLIFWVSNCLQGDAGFGGGDGLPWSYARYDVGVGQDVHAGR